MLCSVAKKKKKKKKIAFVSLQVLAALGVSGCLGVWEQEEPYSHQNGKFFRNGDMNVQAHFIKL